MAAFAVVELDPLADTGFQLERLTDDDDLLLHVFHQLFRFEDISQKVLNSELAEINSPCVTWLLSRISLPPFFWQHGLDPTGGVGTAISCLLDIFCSRDRPTVADWLCTIQRSLWSRTRSNRGAYDHFRRNGRSQASAK